MVELTVTRIGEDTTLGKVKDMIMAAEQSRTPFVRIIDRYAGYYTPTVLMIAGIAWVLSGYDLDRVTTVLVIACPCAVVLATPTAVVAAVAAAARLGIFIKNVNHLELAAKINAFPSPPSDRPCARRANSRASAGAAAWTPTPAS